MVLQLPAGQTSLRTADPASFPEGLGDVLSVFANGAIDITLRYGSIADVPVVTGASGWVWDRRTVDPEVTELIFNAAAPRTLILTPTWYR